MIRSNAERSTQRSLMIGNAAARLELAEVQLARRGTALGPVRLAVDHHRARAADALAAVVVERDRFLAVGEQLLVHDVEELEERHVGAHIGSVIGLELARRVRPGLSPHLEREVHERSA
jgi:hypothetical protein